MPPSTRCALALLLVLCPAPASAQATPTPRPPLAEREVLPGRLRVRVFALDLPGAGGLAPCWLYATDGFRKNGQRELVLAVRRRPAEPPEPFPEDPLSFFATVFNRAAKGQPASEEALTHFDKLLGRGDIGGAIYTRLDPLKAALLQPDVLLVVPLTATELASAQRFGHLRILGLLGAQQRVFPWPGFFDRDRASVASRPDDSDSLLEKMEVTPVRGLRVTAEVPVSSSGLVARGNLVMSLPNASRAAAAARLGKAGAGAGVAWSAELDPEADALAVFQSGQKAPFVARQRDGAVSRLSGTFVAFVPAAETDFARLQEDGFVVSLTSPSWRALEEALAEGRDLQLLGAPESMAIRLRWRD
jgi:hypothetical protein